MNNFKFGLFLIKIRLVLSSFNKILYMPILCLLWKDLSFQYTYLLSCLLKFILKIIFLPLFKNNWLFKVQFTLIKSFIFFISK